MDRKKLRIIIEYEPSEDAERRLQRVFEILLKDEDKKEMRDGEYLPHARPQ